MHASFLQINLTDEILRDFILQHSRPVTARAFLLHSRLSEDRLLIAAKCNHLKLIKRQKVNSYLSWHLSFIALESFPWLWNSRGRIHYLKFAEEYIVREDSYVNNVPDGITKIKTLKHIFHVRGALLEENNILYLRL